MTTSYEAIRLAASRMREHGPIAQLLAARWVAVELMTAAATRGGDLEAAAVLRLARVRLAELDTLASGGDRLGSELLASLLDGVDDAERLEARRDGR